MGEKTLSECSDDELFQELDRRKAEALARAERFNVLSAKSPAKSLSKLEYWAEWREWKAAHPGKTLSDFQKQRVKKGKLSRVLEGSTDRI